jgi:hypothetical protein
MNLNVALCRQRFTWAVNPAGSIKMSSFKSPCFTSRAIWQTVVELEVSISEESELKQHRSYRHCWLVIEGL